MADTATELTAPAEPRCLTRQCRHFSAPEGETAQCPAFPAGIPARILFGDDLHEAVASDQTGSTVYEPSITDGTVILPDQPANVHDIPDIPMPVGAMERQVSFRASTRGARLATLEGREHIVVEIVALIGNITIFPMGAPAPEFVPLEVLAQAPDQWNGRPVVGRIGHPIIGNQLASANEPGTMETDAFGRIFNTRIEGDELVMELWLDPIKAEQIGENAVRACDRARAGQPIEVSVGATVVVERQAGIDKAGRRYELMWAGCWSDHLAILPEGHVGACSNEMGCGLRAAQAMLQQQFEALVQRGGHMTETNPAAVGDKSQQRSLRDRLLALVPLVRFSRKADELRGALSADEMGDMDLRSALSQALAKQVVNFWGIEMVYPGPSTVVYLVDPGPNEPLKFYERSFSVSENGEVSLGDEATEKKPVMQFVDAADVEAPVSAPAVATAAQPAAAVASGSEAPGACGCHGRQGQQAADLAAGKESDMHRNAERIRALIESPKTPWSTTDQPFLEGLADDRLAQFESGMKPAETPQSQPQQVAAAAATQVDMANLPPAVRDIVTEHNARLAAEKSQLVQGVLRSCRGAYTEADLVAMDQAGLRRLHKALDGTDVVDFGPLGSHRGAAVTETTAAPDGWALALQARKGA